jgi:glycine cleavage system aminomethyltransferase T
MRGRAGQVRADHRPRRWHRQRPGAAAPRDNTFWLCLADSDAHLYAMGLAHGRGLNATVSLPEAYPLQVQGPKAKDLMHELAGEAIAGVKYYWTLDAAIAGIPVMISRTGWTGEIGYEVFLTDPARGDELWETIMEAGVPHGIRPIAPCEARPDRGGHLQLQLRLHP